ncbi:hypothetical protein Scep_015119 [Stephania cephalantha]|uniref:Uncharacterized protein n=1 Tax=Stephania cephalantha TaxID=152367 RepID=A0AAP0J4I6_9MAGN
MHALNQFNVYGNHLNGSIPLGFQHLESLTYLNLSSNNFRGNRLTGKIPEVIGLMQALAVLDLNDNELVVPIPPIFGNSTYTGKSYLHGNKLT